jgi:spore coat protein U-like protein
MTTRRFATAAVLAAVALGAAGGAAHAATRTSSVAVRVEVLPSPCTVSSAALDFGTYTAGQAAALDAQTVISYAACGPGTLRVELDGGRSGDPAARRLGRGALAYGLFRDAARSGTFGTGSDAATVSLRAVADGRIVVYGRIPGRQEVAPGTYTDSVTITLSF